jgi:hypothetical protein
LALGCVCDIDIDPLSLRDDGRDRWGWTIREVSELVYWRGRLVVLGLVLGLYRLVLRLQRLYLRLESWNIVRDEGIP